MTRAPLLQVVLCALLTAPLTHATDVGLHDSARTRLEIGALPIVFFSTDDGVSLGTLVQLAGYERGTPLYGWRVAIQAKAAVIGDANGDLTVPHHDHFVRLDLPRVLPGLRLRVDLGFERSVRHWHGLGNASTDVGDASGYTWTHPTLGASARLTLPYHLFVVAGLRFTYNNLEVNAGSQLARDTSDGFVRTDGPHGLVAGQLGLEFDLRNHETVPTRGVLYNLTLTAATTHDRSAYFGELSLGARAYLPLAQELLVLAARLEAHFMVGEPPVYALRSLGNKNGVRGIPAGRYHGLASAVGSLELRSQFWAFRLWDSRMVLGAAAFADTGRVWAQAGTRSPLRDGTGLDLKSGFGGGVRLRWGDSLLIRMDAAGSSDGHAVYVDLDHAF